MAAELGLAVDRLSGDVLSRVPRRWLGRVARISAQERPLDLVDVVCTRGGALRVA
jgi:hypothetical protein